MSITEAVEASLTSEWESTTDIASRIPYRFINSVSHQHLVYKHLQRLVHWGIAEKQLCNNPGHVAYWRRSQEAEE